MVNQPDPAAVAGTVKPIELHVHSFSMRFHLRYRETTGYDVFSYMEEMAARGFTGVNISANGPGFRDLCGTTPDHLHTVRVAAQRLGLKVELDTSDTGVEHMTRMIDVARRVGADTLRTYTKYSAPLADVVSWTKHDLRTIAPIAEDAGVLVVLENHEDFTGPVLADILASVDHPSVRALYDYGNSQMVGEDPFDALDAMAPFIARVHAKDHVLVRTPQGAMVQGVPFGTGRLDVLGTTNRLYDVGVRRFCYENVWAYRAMLATRVAKLPDTPCFVFDDPARFLHGDDLPPAQAVREEREAFTLGLHHFMAMLAEGGYEVRRDPVS
ncbi:MAG: sugar phosphate isomerase/epimerase family protein [Ilumatobacteraceae bacterium]